MQDQINRDRNAGNRILGLFEDHAEARRGASDLEIKAKSCCSAGRSEQIAVRSDQKRRHRLIRLAEILQLLGIFALPTSVLSWYTESQHIGQGTPYAFIIAAIGFMLLISASVLKSIGEYMDHMMNKQ
jgi:hypothetical protein